MVDPGLALGVFAAIVLVAAVVVWPRKGLVPRVAKVLRLTRRVRMEDVVWALLNSPEWIYNQ